MMTSINELMSAQFNIAVIPTILFLLFSCVCLVMTISKNEDNKRYKPIWLFSFIVFFAIFCFFVFLVIKTGGINGE